VSAVTCPSCGSTNCSTVQAVHESGTRDSTGSFGGVGISSHGNLGVFGGVSSSTSTSRLAERCAPPQIPDRVSGFSIVTRFIGLFVILGLIANIPLIIMFAIMFGDDSLDAVPYLAAVIGALCAWQFISGRSLPLYGNRYAALQKQHAEAMETYRRSWVCLACLHPWER
jgi:hypothetical protein